MNKVVRVNEFDRLVGVIQTHKTIECGEGESILDVGCGVGDYTPMFLKKFKKVVGIDPSEKFIKQARKQNKKVDYRVSYGETFKTDEKFDTINMTMLLEHVDNPVSLLKHLKKYLAPMGRIIIHVPNSNSITRRLGVLMGIIPSLSHISKKEKDFYGHKRVYNLSSLIKDCEKADFYDIEFGGILYKPLPNKDLWTLCKKNGNKWTRDFLIALDKFGEGREDECANIYVVCN